MTLVKYPYNYIFAGKACFNIKDGVNTSYSYEVSICNDDYNLYFVRVLNNDTGKQDYAGCFRVNDDGEIKYFKGAKGKYDSNDEVIKLLFDSIYGSNSNLEVNRTKINNCSCCGKEIQLPNLLSIGICSNCLSKYQSYNLKINPNWSFPSGLLMSDISQVIYPNNIDYSSSATKVTPLKKTSSGKTYTTRDAEILSAAEEHMSDTWGVYLDNNNKITQHVYVRTKDDTNLEPEGLEEQPKVDKDGFMDIPIGSTDAEILEKLFASC